MANFAPRYVEKYRDGYRYRRRVPAGVRDKIGRASWTHNFPARTPDSYIMSKAKSLAREHDRAIAVARGQELSPADIEEQEKLAKDWLNDKPRSEIYELIEWAMDSGYAEIPQVKAFLSAVEHDGKYVPQSLTLTAAVQRDKETHSADQDTKALDFALDSFIATVNDKPMTEIKRSDVSDWITAQERRGLKATTIRRRVRGVQRTPAGAGKRPSNVGRTYAQTRQ